MKHYDGFLALQVNYFQGSIIIVNSHHSNEKPQLRAQHQENKTVQETSNANISLRPVKFSESTEKKMIQHEYSMEINHTVAFVCKINKQMASR